MTSQTSRKSKYKIINIRGCNGSGKSHIIRKLMERCDVKPVYGQPKRGELMGRIIAYEGTFKGDPIFFIGSYEVMSGGCDHTMKHHGSMDAVCNFVRQFAGKGHVIFEGFLLTGVYQRFYDLSQELGGIIFCYMDTPLELCFERIKNRNEQKSKSLAGRVRGSMGTKHVEQKMIEGERTRKKFKKAGEKTVLINHKRPLKDIYSILKG